MSAKAQALQDALCPGGAVVQLGVEVARAFSADSAALTALRNSESDNFPSSSLWHSIDSSKSIGWGRSIVKVPNNKEPKH